MKQVIFFNDQNLKSKRTDDQGLKSVEHFVKIEMKTYRTSHLHRFSN